jgi:3-deoxy-D-manno-octulosonic-acid transferase
LYSTLLSGARLALQPFAARSRRLSRLEFGKRQKLPTPVRDFRNREVVWVHAASLGEAKLLLRLIDILKSRHPEQMYVVTAVTQSGVSYLEQCRNESVCAVGYLPWDTLSMMKRMLAHFSVTRVWLLETELWPSMVCACMQKGIPIGIANARMEEGSFRWYRRFLPVLRPLFEHMDVVLAQDEQYAQRYKIMGVRPSKVVVTGNIKGRVVIERPARTEWLARRQALCCGSDDLVVTAGCVHPEEAPVLRRAIDRCRDLGLRLRWIIVPRHLDRTSAIVEHMPPGTQHVRHNQVSGGWPVCVVERFGVLESMYSIADVAFVGGTFNSVGGHNVWEAAQFGIPVFFGPDYHTQFESCKRLLDAGIGYKANDAEELAGKIKRVMTSDAARFIEAQQAFMASAQDGIRELEPLIP